MCASVDVLDDLVQRFVEPLGCCKYFFMCLSAVAK